MPLRFVLLPSSRRCSSPLRGVPVSPRRRRAFTLVELLVAVAVTVIMILALVRMFVLVGRSASKGRAILEMSGQLRSVVMRLEQDLEGLTVPARPWAQGSASPGYLEYYEGVERDYQPNRRNTTPSGLPNTLPHTALGDLDDVLMFTSQATGEPFRGQLTDLLGNVRTIESPLAEIFWWTRLDGDKANLYRRALLIRPDLNDSNGVFRTIPFTTDEAGLLRLRNELLRFFNTNDISVRMQRRTTSGNWFIDLIANSLADLSNRGNRFARHPIVLEDLQNTPRFSGAPAPSFPYQLDVDRFRFDANGYAVYPTRRSITSLQQLDQPLDAQTLQQYSLQALDQSWLAQLGEDVILSSVVAFDVKAFDLQAWVVVDDPANPSESFRPGDPAYLNAYAPANRIGTGAFVDLNYANLTGTPFSGPPAFVDANGNGAWDWTDDNGNGDFDFTDSHERLLSGLDASRATYDTWTLDYELDGINQDGDTVNLSNNGVDDNQDGTIDDAGEASMPLIDEGANEIDDDGVYGVDDVGERETSPPYPAPLRGLQIQIRMIESATRQVRQATVVSDFTPE